jgi:hypothetical protein
MALDRSFGLHTICVRVGSGHKERGQAFGVSFIIHGLYGEHFSLEHNPSKIPFLCRTRPDYAPM